MTLAWPKGTKTFRVINTPGLFIASDMSMRLINNVPRVMLEDATQNRPIYQTIVASGNLMEAGRIDPNACNTSETARGLKSAKRSLVEEGASRG